MKKSLYLGLFLLLYLGGSIGFAQTDQDCLMCHGDSTMMQSMGVENWQPLVLDTARYDGSVHQQMGGCVNCHSDISEFPHPDTVMQVDCGMCHYEEQEEWQNSSHGLSVQAGHKDAATCVSCHTEHYQYPATDTLSTVHPANEWKTCAKCHSNQELIQEYHIPQPEAVAMWKTTVHGRALIQQKNYDAATCSDCHGAHNVLPGRNFQSQMNKFNVPETCGKCHSEIYGKYEQSIHGGALSEGNFDAPACTDCHGEHTIRRVESEASLVSKRLQVERTCSKCHDDPDLRAKYGFGREDQVSTYQDSYHGLAVLRGDEDAASCADCHTAHLILPQTDPLSSVNRSNIAQTCGQCHDNATTQFGMSYTHESVMLGRYPVQTIIKWIYILLIVVVIGGMFIHNTVIYVHNARAKYLHELRESFIVRMTKNEVWQHVALTGSFITLAITGFALKWPDTGWVKLLTYIGLTETLRGTIHRVAAVILIALSAYHLYYLIFTRRGREEFRELMFKLKDITQFRTAIAYYFGKRPTPPAYDHYDYTQKAEYWALIWGTAVMAITGLILWFPTIFGENTPQWLIKVSETIHYYEAILATLAIIIWHFFFTIFDPDTYPMDMTWLHGRMTLEEWRHKHPEKYRRMMQDVERYERGELRWEELSAPLQKYIQEQKEDSGEHSSP